jgi:hypothetical protein
MHVQTLHQSQGNHTMKSSSAAKTNAGRGYHSEADVVAAKPDNWKSQLALRLRVDHSRPESFCKLIDNYIQGVVSEREDVDLSSLINGCMKNQELLLLRDILKYEDITHLKRQCLVGPVDEDGWDTLIQAMPGTFPGEELTMANMDLDLPAIEGLIEVLHRMPDLRELYLTRVRIKSGTDLRELAWPVSNLKDLTVFAESGADCSAWLFNFLHRSGKLEKLTLENTQLPVRDFNALLEAVRKKNMSRI